MIYKAGVYPRYFSSIIENVEILWTLYCIILFPSSLSSMSGVCCQCQNIFIDGKCWSWSPAQDMSSDIAQTALTRPERLRLIWRLFVTCTHKWPLQVIIVTHWLGDKSAVFSELPALNCSGLPWIHQKCQLMENYLKISIFFTPSSNLSINLFLFHNERHYGFQKLIPPTSFLNFPRISLKNTCYFQQSRPAHTFWPLQFIEKCHQS